MWYAQFLIPFKPKQPVVRSQPKCNDIRLSRYCVLDDQHTDLVLQKFFFCFWKQQHQQLQQGGELSEKGEQVESQSIKLSKRSRGRRTYNNSGVATSVVKDNWCFDWLLAIKGWVIHLLDLFEITCKTSYLKLHCLTLSKIHYCSWIMYFIFFWLVCSSLAYHTLTPFWSAQ